MGQMLSVLLEDWGEGVNTSLSPDRLPPGASPRGWNSVFQGVGTGRITVARRGGLNTINATAITGTPAVLGQYGYRRLATGAYTYYHLVVSDAGRLDRIYLGSAAAADSGTAAPFTAGTLYPAFETANNLCFIVNGTDKKKFDGTDVWNFGITRPTVGTMSGAAGAVGSPNGTYELRVTYYNANTAVESSASNTATAAVTVTSDVISVSDIPVSTDPQVTARKLYVRNTSTMAVFYYAGIVSDNTTTTATLDFADASLIIEAPDTAENDPPVDGVKYLAWHASRMFAASDTSLYYSAIDKPESFDPDFVISVNPDDGQRIKGILSAFEVLIIFKERSIYALYGTDPNSWEVRLIVSDVGCVAGRTIVGAEGRVFWMWTTGLCEMATLGAVNPVGAIYLSTTFHPTTLQHAEFGICVAAADVANQRILLAVPDILQTKNTRIIVYNYRVGKFESEKWDPMDVSDLAEIDDVNGVKLVSLGGYEGQCFQMNYGYNDGVASGTAAGTITSVNGTSTVFTDSTATFNTTGGGLVERTIYFTSPDGLTIVRRRITANAATTVTVAASVTVLAGWTYIIGAINFQWDTPWVLVDPRFFKKRLRFLYAAVNGGGTTYFDLFLNNSFSVVDTLSNVTTTGGALWGTFLWGVTPLGSSSPDSDYRYRIGRTGELARIRIRHLENDEPLVLSAVSLSAELKSDRVG